MRIDPREKDPQYREVFNEIDKQLQEEFKDKPQTSGMIKAIWARKQELVYERLGFEWETPEDLNPHITFD